MSSQIRKWFVDRISPLFAVLRFAKLTLVVHHASLTWRGSECTWSRCSDRSKRRPIRYAWTTTCLTVSMNTCLRDASITFFQLCATTPFRRVISRIPNQFRGSFAALTVWCWRMTSAKGSLSKQDRLKWCRNCYPIVPVCLPSDTKVIKGAFKLSTKVSSSLVASITHPDTAMQHSYLDGSIGETTFSLFTT